MNVLFSPHKTPNHVVSSIILRELHFFSIATLLSLAADLYGQPVTSLEKHASRRPNIILIMSDDQGWGDVAYNGNTVVQTPNLDEMAREGLRLERFYAAAPVCSPARGSCLTGRHPYRYGIYWPNVYPLPAAELTLAEALKHGGYRTGHFGKWHLGTMTADVKDGPLRMQRPLAEYSPPWNHGFDVCFSTEINGPTYNPLVWDTKYSKGGIMSRPVAAGETTSIPGVVSTHEYFRQEFAFWTGPGATDTTNVDGDSSRIIMDRALSFIDESATADDQFLAVIWFFSPHSPIAAGDSHRKHYHELTMEEQHWFGCLTAMDEQIGRLREHLRELNIAQDTVLWFCSDNGPSWIHEYNSAGPFRDKKGSLYEGGIRVPALIEWPARFKKPRVVETPISTSDFYPTLLRWARVELADQPKPLDGMDVTAMLDGEMRERPQPIFFQSPSRNSAGGGGWEMNSDPTTRQLAAEDNRFKLISTNDGKSWELYDLLRDPGEQTNVIAAHPDIAAMLRTQLLDWVKSCDRSRAGADYSTASGQDKK